MGFKSLSLGLLVLALGLTGPGNKTKTINLDPKPSYSAEQSLAYGSLEQTIERAAANNISLESIRLYQAAGVSSQSTIDYFLFLGIAPETVLRYVSEGVFESSDIINQEFCKGNISPMAKELFDYYNITHPERYDIRIIDQLLASMMGGENGRPGLFVLFDDEILQEKVSKENVVLEFSENLLTGNVKEGYAGKFYNPDVNLMIFEIDENPGLKGKIEGAKKKFDEYRIGGILISKYDHGHGIKTYSISHMGVDHKGIEELLLFFSNEERGEFISSMFLEAIINSDNLKVFEEYTQLGVYSYDEVEFLNMVGIIPEKIKDSLTPKEIKGCSRQGMDSSTLRRLFSDIPEDAKKVFDYYSIKRPWMLSAKLFKELKQNMHGIPQDGKPISVVLIGHDYNGGFEMAKFQELLKGYHVLLYEVSDDNTAIKRITEAGERYGRIDLLWIYSHSGRNSIGFSGYDNSTKLGINEGDKIRQIALYLGEDSIIVLEGCNNAQGGNNANNIARAIHDNTKAIVYGTATQSEGCSPEMQEDGKVTNVLCDEKNAVKF